MPQYLYRVAVLGGRNATPVTGPFPSVAAARDHAHAIAGRYPGRQLVLKAYYRSRVLPVRGMAPIPIGACESARSCDAAAGVCVS